jgi:signal transduction histidine kinase
MHLNPIPSGLRLLPPSTLPFIPIFSLKSHFRQADLVRRAMATTTTISAGRPSFPMACASAPHNSAEASQYLQAIKQQFLAGLNFEIRTPLSGILGMADLLMETPLNSEQLEYVSATRVCAENLLELLNATLELSAVSAGSSQSEESEFDLAELLRSALSEQRNKARFRALQLSCGLHPDLPRTLIGNGVRLRQLISLLVGNALKFTAQGEVEVIVSCARREQDQIDLEISLRSSEVSVTLSQLQAMVRERSPEEPEFSAAHPGLSLELALMRKILLAMHGSIVLQGSGVGLELTVLLPFRIETPPSEPAALPIPGTDCRVLVVDDNEVARLVASHILRRSGYEVDTVCSGEEAALAVVRTRYNLILMDLQMPGLDGFETTALIRELPDYRHVPIVAVTADTTRDHASMCHDYGLDAWIPKPVRAAELLALMRRVMAVS